MQSLPTRAVIFDQFSRYRACSDWLAALGAGAATILDVGSGPECLLSRFLSTASITYVDPLLESRTIGPNDRRICGDIHSPELDGETFEFVVCVDTLEHIRTADRALFIDRLASLARKGLVLAFPASDFGDAVETDQWINETFKGAFGRDYLWLAEHFRDKLPSVKATRKQLESAGFRILASQNGNTDLLKEFLGFTVCAWELPELRSVVLDLSEYFNKNLVQYDHLPPSYRTILAAYRPGIRIRAPKLLADKNIARKNASVKASLLRQRIAAATGRAMLALHHNSEKKDAELQTLTAHLKEASVWGQQLDQDLRTAHEQLEKQKSAVAEVSGWTKRLQDELVDTRAQLEKAQSAIQEVSVWGKNLEQELAGARSALSVKDRELSDKRAELMKLSDWAQGLNREAQQLRDELDAKDRQLTDKHAELMSMSDWASGMKQALDRWNAHPVFRAKQAVELAVIALKRRLSRSPIAPALRYIRNRRRFATVKVSFESVRRSVTDNGGRLVIAFPIITWEFRWQRPQQILSRLRDHGFAILYLAMTVAPKGRPYRNAVDAGADISLTHLDRHIHQVWLHGETSLNVYKDPLNGGNLSNLILGMSGLIENLNVRDILYIVQFPGWGPLATGLRERFGGKVIFDCMDDHSGFSNNTAEALKNEEVLIKNADLVIASSTLLEQRLHMLNPTTILVRNGTEFEHFANPAPNDELSNLIGHSVIGYHGAISDWFDVGLIEYCAANRPDWRFVLIGSNVGCDTRPLERLSNILMLGEKPYRELPGYLAYFDVCTIPFKLTPLTLATNPVKFYEYLSAGKPVVAVDLPELRLLQDICYLAHDKAEFLERLDQALREKDNPELIRKRTEVARNNSWDSRVETLLAHPVLSARV